MQRLDTTFFGSIFMGRNVFADVENQRYLFWLNTGELPETLVDITSDVSSALNRFNRRGQEIQRCRMSKLSLTNQVLLAMIWLRKYPCLDTLALLFDISPSTVSRSFPDAVGCIDGTPH